jgi:DNA polymerase-3 subunit alpha
LGLDTLDVIDDTLKIIKNLYNIDIDINDIPMDDKATFDMIGKGDTMGVFQLESSLAPLCMKIKPSSVDEISDINALGRPSCSAEDREAYIERKFGRQEIKYRHPRLENALAKTYGIALYEESMMKIAKDCSNWDLNQADALRKITKLKGKNQELVEKTKSDFTKDCMKYSGMSKFEAEDIWVNEIEPFGLYGFNKSHSISYSYISYYTAWLKCNYPTEFMCALLNSEVSNSDKAMEYINECANIGIKITPPHINSSRHGYVITGPKQIATGLSAVKGVGDKALNEILSLQPYKNIEDFLSKTNARVVNKSVIQALAKAGVFESFNRTRKDIYENYEKYRTKIKAELKKEIPIEEIVLPEYHEEWDKKELLLSEREVLGRTISGSLHEIFQGFFKNNSSVTPLRKIDGLPIGDRIKIEVIINSKIKEFTIKKGKNIGKKFAKYLVEDADGSTAELTVWQSDYEQYNHLMKDGIPIKAICKVDEYMEQKSLSLASLEGILGK